MTQITSNIALDAFRKYGDTVLRAAYACCGCFAEAEDITQEVFLSLHAKPQSFTDENHLKAWLLRAAVNRCKNYHNSFTKKKRVALEDADSCALMCEFTPEDDTVRKAVAKLPAKYSSVLYLYYFEEYNIREIADMLGKNENTVSSLLRRARQKIKPLLLDEEAQLV